MKTKKMLILALVLTFVAVPSFTLATDSPSVKIEEPLRGPGTYVSGIAGPWCKYKSEVTKTLPYVSGNMGGYLNLSRYDYKTGYIRGIYEGVLVPGYLPY